MLLQTAAAMTRMSTSELPSTLVGVPSTIPLATRGTAIGRFGDLQPLSTSRIQPKDLKDDQRLASLYLSFVNEGTVKNSDRDFISFVSYAEKALADDRQGTPGKLFKHLVLANDQRIANDHEDRALKRFSARDRHALVELISSASQVLSPDNALAIHSELFGDLEPDSEHHRLGFLPAVLMQCFLPQKELPQEQRTWESRHGQASLLVNAGTIMVNFERVNCNVPYGRHARIVLPYICSYAWSHNTRDIFMGKSLRGFLQQLGVEWHSREAASYKQALIDIAAAQLLLAHWDDDSSQNKFARIFDSLTVLHPANAQGMVKWDAEMTITNEFFDAITRRRPIPINLGHVLTLARSPRRVDLYLWLSYRSPFLRDRETVRVPISQLHAIFGPDIRDMKQFKRRLKQDLDAITQLHPFDLTFRADIDYLEVRKSAPPIPFKERPKLATE